MFKKLSLLITRTSETEDGDEISGNYDATSAINVPGRSISTLAFSGQLVNAVATAPVQPAGFSLSQNYPNQFNPATTIEFSLPVQSFVQLTIYDVLGREIRTLVNEKMSPGKHKAHFNATDAKSGIYFYRIKAGDFSQTVKMLLIR